MGKRKERWPEGARLLLGHCDRLDVDFLALLADGAAATGVVRATSQGPSVEAVLELLPVLRFPGLDGEAVLLLDLVPIPFWDDVERAEGYDAEVGRQVVDVAALETFFVLIVLMVEKRLYAGLKADNGYTYDPALSAPNHNPVVWLD